METTAITNSTAYYYYAALQRYARRLIKDEAAAADIAAQALKDLAHTEGPVICKRLRQFIKMDVQNRCHYWKQSRIFDRSPVYIPLPIASDHCTTNDNKQDPAARS